MKRKLRMFLPLVCAAILLMGMTAMAAELGGTCGTCDVALRTVSREAGHWETTHMVRTGYYVGGVEILEKCTVLHVKTEIVEYCPNGHVETVIQVNTDEYHSSNLCKDSHY